MKKLVLGISGLFTLSFVVTLLVFVYKYIWFAIDTVPFERWLVAIGGLFFTACLTFGMIEDKWYE